MEYIDDAARNALIQTARDTLPGSCEVYPGNIQFSLPARYADGRTAPAVPLSYRISRSRWTGTPLVEVLDGTGHVLKSTLDVIEAAPEHLARAAACHYNALNTGRTIVGHFFYG